MVTERVNRNNTQSYKVPSGYKYKGSGQYAYGKWFISLNSNEGSVLNSIGQLQLSWGSTPRKCATRTYGLDNYSRYKWGDFSITIANTSIPFELYQTSDGKGYFASTKVKGQCVIIGVYQSGRFAISANFDYEKHITNIYEYLYLNN